jgi:WD40 repeat protein
MKFSFLIVLISFISVKNIAQQQIEPVLQSSHSSRIEFYSYNEEKNILLTADEKEVMLWNKYSGKQLRRIASPYTIRGAALCSNGEEVAVISYEYAKDAALRIYNARNGELKAEISFRKKSSWSVPSYETLDELVTDDINNRVAIRYFNKMAVVDIKTRKRLFDFELYSFNTKFSFTDNAGLFACSYPEKKEINFALIDTTGKILHNSILTSGAEPLTLISNAGQNKFYLLDSKAFIHVIDKKGEKINSIKADSVSSLAAYSTYSLAISADEKILLAPLHEKQYLYNFEKKQWEDHKWQWVNTSDLLYFAGADEAVLLRDRLPFIIETETGKELKMLSGKTHASKNIRFSPSNRMMSIYNVSSLSASSQVLDLKTGMQFGESDFNYGIFEWITDSVVLCAVTPEYDAKEGEFIHQVQIKNIYSGKVLHSISVSKVEFNIDYAAISKDRKKIAFVSMQKAYIYSGEKFEKATVYRMPDNYGAKKVYFTPDSKKLVLPTDVIRIYDLDTRKWKALKDTALYGFDEVAISNDGKEIWYEQYKSFKNVATGLDENQQAIFTYNIEKDLLSVKGIYDTLIGAVVIHPAEDLYAIGFSNGSIQLRRRSNDSLLFAGKLHHDWIDGLSFATAKTWLIAAGKDGLLKFLNYKTHQHFVTTTLLYKDGETGFATITPENYYLVPAPLINELHFVKDFDTYSFAQLDLKLNRPDKVLQAFGLADNDLLQLYQKAYQRRLNKAGFTSADSLPDVATLEPVIIANRKKIAGRTSGDSLQIQLQTKHNPSDIRALHIYINGQRVQQLPGNVSQWNTSVELNSGKNNIEAAYISKSGMESLRERIELEYEPAVPVKETTIYVGIAISGYKDSAMNLQYAVKDVTDIAAKFKAKDSSIQTYLFTNEQAVKDNFRAIRKILAATGVNDKVIVSFSGHGMLDTAYNFYFAGWDMNFTAPQQNGISFNDISSLLNDVPARRKMILIDACHSGEVDRDVISFAATANPDTAFVKKYVRGQKLLGKGKSNTNIAKLMEQYFSDIAKDNGANIISAAAGEEYALESDEWNNGVFSYSFIKGLFEKKADNNYDGKVTQSEIRKYMQQMVLQLTQGKQQPAARSINSDYDWVL